MQLARSTSALAILWLSACGQATSDTATLYRNSSLNASMRIHFASFDTPEDGYYNLSNCQMAARVLNANVDANAERNGGSRDVSLGFWCESGGFNDEGMVPLSFESELPTDAR